MNTIDYLRDEIKRHFPESSELQLSGDFAQRRRFNFYFKIKDKYPYLLYLNWDGEYDQFILKCLEFVNEEILEKLIAEYPESGAKTFNLGKPCFTVSFIYHARNLKSSPLALLSADFLRPIRFFGVYADSPLTLRHPYTRGEATLDPAISAADS